MEHRPKWPVLAIKVLVFFVGAHFSYHYAANYWIVGPIFGVVVLFWNARWFRQMASVQNLGFLSVSTAIYALVYWISDHYSKDDRAFYAAVAVGTVLLPIAHKLFLGGVWRRIAVAVPALYASWYSVAVIVERLDLSGPAEKIVNFVSVWQALYLIILFWPTAFDHE